MNMHEIFDFNDVPKDPVELGGKSGALFVPVPGLCADERDFFVSNLKFVRLHPRSWRIIEKNWIVDMYLELYGATPRFYCVFPFDSEDGFDPSNFEELAQPHINNLKQFLFAARLVQPGTLVDPERVAFVFRVAWINYRLVGGGRFRLYGTVFGDDVVLQPKQRELGDHAVYYEPRIISSAGTAYRVDNDSIIEIERMLNLYKLYLDGPTNSGIDMAIRNFTKGQDIFLFQRQRIFCLLTALEATFGKFNYPKKVPSLGQRVSQAYQFFRGGSTQIENRVEQDLRAVRNAIAHSAEYRRRLDYGVAEEFVVDILRVGLPPLLRLALHQRTKHTEIDLIIHKKNYLTPVLAFQELLDLASSGNSQAAQFLTDLNS